MSQYNSTWSDATTRYQSTVGAVSAESAFELVSLATDLSPFTSESAVLDAGVGPGAVTLAIKSQSPTTTITATDTSPAMLAQLETTLEKSKHSSSNLTRLSSDINDLSKTFQPHTFSHVFASFVLHVATTDFVGVVKQIHTTLKPDGVIAIATFSPHTEAYLVWDRVCRIFDPDYQQPAISVDPKAWGSPGETGAGLQKLGFGDVKTVLRRKEFPLKTAEEWSDFWFGGKNPAAELVVRPFFESHEVSVEDVKPVYERIIRDEWWNGKILVEIILAVGRK